MKISKELTEEQKLDLVVNFIVTIVLWGLVAIIFAFGYWAGRISG